MRFDNDDRFDVGDGPFHVFFLILQNLFLNFIEIERHLTVKVVII